MVMKMLLCQLLQLQLLLLVELRRFVWQSEVKSRATIASIKTNAKRQTVVAIVAACSR